MNMKFVLPTPRQSFRRHVKNRMVAVARVAVAVVMAAMSPAVSAEVTLSPTAPKVTTPPPVSAQMSLTMSPVIPQMSMTMSPVSAAASMTMMPPMTMKPSPPTTVTLNGDSKLAAGENKGRIFVEWSGAKSNGGGGINDYFIRWRLANSNNWLNDNGADGVSVGFSSKNEETIVGLAVGATYEVQVAAHNDVDTGPWSMSETAFTATKPDKMEWGFDKPLTAGKNEIFVEWKTPTETIATGAADIIGYRLRWRTLKTDTTPASAWNIGDDDEQGIMLGVATTFTITDLDAVAYEVYVAAINRLGRGSWSLKRQATPIQNHFPTFTPSTLNLIFTLNQPANYTLPDPGGDPPITYSVATSATGGANFPPGITFDETAATIGGVPAELGETQANITARDADGDQAAVSLNMQVVAITAPRNVAVDVAGANHTWVTWSPPDVAPGNYRIRWRPAGADAWSNSAGENGEEIAAATRRYDIGATAGVAHEVQVAAVLNANIGEWSAAAFYRYDLPGGLRNYIVGIAAEDSLPNWYDPGGDVTYTLTKRDSPNQNDAEIFPGLTFDAANNTITGAPDEAESEAQIFIHTATAGDASETGNFIFRVSSARFETTAIADQIWNRNIKITPLVLPAAEGVGLMYALSPPLPPGLIFNAAAREINGTPTTASPREVYTYTVTAADGGEIALRFAIQVKEELHFAGTPQNHLYELNVSETVSLALPFIDSNSAVVYAIDNALPSGLTFDGALRRIFGTPDAVTTAREFILSARQEDGSVGEWPFQIEVSDGVYFDAKVADQNYTVNESIAPLMLPQLSGNTAGDVTFTLSASTALPAGLTYNESDSEIIGTPTVTGATEITLTATNPDSVSITFTIRVFAAESKTLSANISNATGGVIEITPSAMTPPNMDTQFILKDGGDATDARLGLDYTVSDAEFNIAMGANVASPQTITVTVREAADNYMSQLQRRAILLAVPEGDAAEFKTTTFAPLMLTDIDADTARLRLRLIDATTAAEVTTFESRAPRMVKIRAELYRPGDDSAAEQTITAAADITATFTHPTKLGAADAPRELTIAARNSAATSAPYLLTPTSAGTFSFARATFTPDIGRFQSADDVDMQQVIVMKPPPRIFSVPNAPVILGEDAGDAKTFQVAFTAGDAVTVMVNIAADDAAANSATANDFLNADGEVATTFPIAYQITTTAGATFFSAPIRLNHADAAVEGGESFTVMLSAPGATPHTETISISASGEAQLNVRASPAVMNAETIFTGTLNFPRAQNPFAAAIVVGGGGELQFANANIPPQVLTFTDADDNGIIEGGELTARSDAWTVTDFSREHVFTLQNQSNLPANLTAEQFLPADGATAHVPVQSLVAFANTNITLSESITADEAAMVFVTITPPLARAAELTLSYSSVTATATADDEQNPDYNPTMSVTLPAAATTFPLPILIYDDRLIESNETFRITLAAADNENEYALADDAKVLTLTIVDNDIAQVAFSASPIDAPLTVLPGTEISLMARIIDALQVGEGGVVTFVDAEKNVAVSFTDTGGDGLLSGGELTETFIYVSPFGTAAADEFTFTLADNPPRGLNADDFNFGELRVQKLPPPALQILGAAAARIENAIDAYQVPVRLNADIEYAFGVDVTAAFAGATITKKISFAAGDDASETKNAEFSAADFNAIGLTDNNILEARNSMREILFSARFDADAIAAGAAQDTSDGAMHLLAIEDDEKSALAQWTLVNSAGEKIEHFRTGTSAIAHLKAELINPQDNSAVIVGDSFGLNLFPQFVNEPGAAQLNGLSLPVVNILPGQSETTSARFVIAPETDGKIRITTNFLFPPLLNEFNVRLVDHFANTDATTAAAEFNRARDVMLIVPNQNGAILEEGSGGNTLQFRITDLNGAPATLQENGADVAARLTYKIAAVFFPGSPANADDLTGSFATHTVTITAGATFGTIPIPDIVDDDMEEPDESFSIRITNLTNAAGDKIDGAEIPAANAEVTYVIAANDGVDAGDTTLGVAIAGDALESAGTFTLTLTRPNGIDSDTEIAGSFFDTPATAGRDDYAAAPNFSLPPGVDTINVDWPLVDDGIIEGDENFSIVAFISSPLDGTVTEPAAVTVTITDDDTGAVGFENTALASKEDFVFHGGIVDIKILLSAATARDVHYTLIPDFGGTATASANDFIDHRTGRAATDASALTVNGFFIAGETESVISFIAAEDEDMDDETLIMRLSFTGEASKHGGNLTLGDAAANITLRPMRKETLTIIPAAAEKIYGAHDPETLIYGANFHDDDTAETVFSETPFMRAPGETAGEYAYARKTPPPFNEGFAAKYKIIVDGAASFSIRAKPVTYTSTAAVKIYDGTSAAPAGLENLGGSFAPGDLVNAEINGMRIDDTAAGKITVSGGMFAAKNVGDDKIISNLTLGGDAAGNYTATFHVRGGISKRKLIVAANDAYGVNKSKLPPQELTYAIAAGETGEGIAAGETASDALTGALEYAAADDGGNFPIVRGSLTATENYSLADADFTPGLFFTASASSVLNVDGDAETGATDGILIARYLLGLRGGMLTANMKNLSGNAAAITAAIAAAKQNGSLDADDINGITAADGIMIARYLLGVTSAAALTAGQTTAAAAEVKTRIQNMLKPPPQ